MNVLAYSRSALKENRQSDKVTYATVDEILEKSDIVTIHCPLNNDSEKMCNKEFFTKMKKDSLFINTSRGGVVNQEDLMWALNNNVIQYAALDAVSYTHLDVYKRQTLC